MADEILKKVAITPELVSETEMLKIYGGAGSDDVHVYTVESCKTNTFCEGANCVEQCACGGDPDPDKEDD